MEADIEIWKDIEGYDGFYQVSNFGRVRSVDRYIKNKKYKGALLKPNKTIWGYYDVKIKGKHYSIHRLVYTAFVGNIPFDKEINHINEDKTDNHPQNLQAVSKSVNINWGDRNNSVRKKLSIPVIQCLKDGTEYFGWFSITDASKALSIKDSNISQCCKGKREIAGGFKWRYAY